MSGGAGSLTSGTSPVGTDPQYTCEDWVSRLFAKKLGLISREYRLRHLPRWATLDERPHLPPLGYMAISEAILKT